MWGFTLFHIFLETWGLIVSLLCATGLQILDYCHSDELLVIISNGLPLNLLFRRPMFWLVLLSSIFYILTIYSLILTNLAPKGIPKIIAQETGRIHDLDDFNNSSLSLDKVLSRSNKYPYGIPGEFKGFCDRCEFPKPFRSGHCSECDVCILRMDHHCYYLGFCIGLYNYKPFFSSICYSVIGLVISSIYWLTDFLNAKYGSALKISYGLITFLAIGCFAILFQLLCVHLVLIFTNRTTREYLLEPLSYLPDTAPSVDRYPSTIYKKSTYANIYEFLGPWWGWCIPTIFYISDGFQYHGPQTPSDPFP